MIIDPYRWRVCKIARIIHESPAAVSVQLMVDGDYLYECGQHAVVRVKLPDGTKLVRQYSFASAPSSGELWLTVVHTPGGEVSSWFMTSAVGDTIEISQPLSGPLQHDISHRRVCMIAGGSGIVPLMSHLREQRYIAADTHITLLYSTRSNTRCYRDELTSDGSETIVISTTDSDQRINPEQVRKHCAAADIVMICGSRPFTKAMRDACKDSVSEDAIFAETFSL